MRKSILWCWSSLAASLTTSPDGAIFVTSFGLLASKDTISRRRRAAFPPSSLLGRQKTPQLDITAFQISLSATTTDDDDNASSNNMNQDGGSWLSLDPNDLSVGERYGFFISAIVPRPVAVITTRSDGGIVNCAPFSYTSLSSHDPPIVTHGIALMGQGDDRKKKDTLRNIEETGEWVMNILTRPYLSQANDCAAMFPADQEETVAVGLTTLPCESVQAPRLEDAAVALECRLWDQKEVRNDQGEHTTTIVMGRVVRIHVHSSVLTKRDDDTVDNDPSLLPPLVDLFKLQAVGRAGDVTYWPVGISDPDTDTLPMPRPK
jgi:flavin reductase (DIM6/NTAB) family NADH-FMN oxidoreductase RutF